MIGPQPAGRQRPDRHRGIPNGRLARLEPGRARLHVFHSQVLQLLATILNFAAAVRIAQAFQRHHAPNDRRMHRSQTVALVEPAQRSSARRRPGLYAARATADDADTICRSGPAAPKTRSQQSTPVPAGRPGHRGIGQFSGSLKNNSRIPDRGSSRRTGRRAEIIDRGTIMRPRPSADRVQVSGQPLRPEHDLRRDRRTTFVRNLTEQGQIIASEAVDRVGAPVGQDGRPGPPHVLGAWIMARQFQREIGLHAST